MALCKRTQHCWPTTPNIVGCYMLRPFAHPVVCSRMLLRVDAQSLKLVKIFSQQLWTFLLFRDCTALPTLLGPRTLITHLLQRLMSCILPTMHCRSKTCWELLHPFASVSQHCWRNNVRSCCARLHAAYSARSVAHVCKTLVCGHVFRNLRTFS